MMKQFKRVLSMVLVVVMLVGMFPVQAYAEDLNMHGEGTSPSIWDMVGGNLGVDMQDLYGDDPDTGVTTPVPETDTYVFMVGGETVSTQTVIEGDELLRPKSPEQENAKFLGWYLNGDKNSATAPFGTVTAVSGGEDPIVYKAVFEPVTYAFFIINGKVCHTAEGTGTGAVAADQITMANASAGAYIDKTQAISGWASSEQDAENNLPAGNINYGGSYYAIVKDGFWVTYDSAGGSPVAPVFCLGSITVADAPSRPGYVFEGWYNGTDKVEGTFTPDGEVTLTAKWTEKEDVEYTIIHWQQNANNDEYTYAGSETVKGKTGDWTTAEAKSNYKFGSMVVNGKTLSDANAFVPKKIEQQQIAGDGSTVVNVYYDRKEYTVEITGAYTCGNEAHKHTYDSSSGYGNNKTYYGGCYPSSGGKTPTCGKTEHTHTNKCPKGLKITARWGAFIGNQWPTGGWYVDGSSNWQSYVEVMPIGGAKYGNEVSANSTSTQTASYYIQTLPDENGNTTYVWDHDETAKGSGATVTNEERHPLTGFKINDSLSTKNRQPFNGAKFYYDRETFYITYVNGTTQKQVGYLYEQSIADGNIPVTQVGGKPESVEDGFVFAGWYDNPKGSGDPYVFTGKTMPAYGITLYAVWKAPTYKATVRVSMGTSDGAQGLTVDYGTSIAENPNWSAAYGAVLAAHNGEAPAAWIDVATGNVFDINQVVTKDVVIEPFYPTTGEGYSVTYENGGNVTDEKSYMLNTQADVKAPENKTDFLYWEVEGSKVYPGDKLTITGDMLLTAVYGKQPTTTTVTYHSNYPDGSDSTVAVNEIPANTYYNVDGAKFDPPAGYEFAGWSASPNGNKVTKVFVTRRGENNLYAKWTPIDYTIKYDLNGGSTTSEKTEFTEQHYGDATPTIAEPTRENYKFTGWSPKVEKTVKGDATYTAQWELQVYNYTVKYVVNGHNDVEVADAITTTGNAGSELTLTVKSVDGYTHIDNNATSVVLDKNNKTFYIYYYKNLELQADSKTFTYDGKPHEAKGYVITSNQVPGLVPDLSSIRGLGDSANLPTSDPYTNVGDYPNNFADGVVGQIDSTGVYKITKAENGLLKITPATNKVTVTITEKSDSVPYDGEEHSITGYKSIVADNDLYDVTTAVKETATDAWTAKGTDKGNYPVGIVAGDFENIDKNFSNVEFVIVDGELVINKAKMTITINGTQKTETYNGKDQYSEGFDATVKDGPAKLFDSKKVVYDGTAKVTAKDARDEAYTMNLVIGNFSYNDGNFDVTFELGEDGWLKINPAKVTVKADQKSKTYGDDDPELTATITGLKNGESESLIACYLSRDSGEDVGEYTIYATAEPKATEGGDAESASMSAAYAGGDEEGVLQGNYIVTYENDKLIINPYTLYVETESAEKIYDGKALTAPGKITDPVKGETLTFTVTGTQTEPGETDNTYDVAFDGTAKKSNYEVKEKSVGKLTVSKFTGEVKITTVGGSKVYDGKELGATVKVSGLPTTGGYSATASSNATVLNVKDGKVKAYADNVVIKMANGTVVYERKDGKETVAPDGFTVTIEEPDQIWITKRPVTFESASAEKIYDGEVLRAPTVEIKNKKMVAGEEKGVTFNVTGELLGNPVTRSTAKNTFTYKFDNKIALESNYAVKKSEGRLLVTPEPLFRLTIHYVFAEGGQAAPDYVGWFVEGDQYEVHSPAIEDYTPDYAFIRSGAQGMPAAHIEFTVVYTKNEEREIPGIEVVPTDDGYDLTVVEDDEVPLAEGDHVDDIMHFLLMAAALIVEAFYTDKRKKHQKKIFEMKKQLGDTSMDEE